MPVSALVPRTVPGLNLTLLPIPAGTFTMGSPADEPGHYEQESPQTQVTISKPFWLGKFVVTQGQWQALMGTDLVEQARRMLADDTRYTMNRKFQTIRDALGLKKDSDPQGLLGNLGDDYPMYYVNWAEAMAFCRKLTERDAGQLPEGYEYRLPTEAEWEYACRAGTTEATYAGKMEIKGAKNAPVLDAIAWYGGNSSEGYTGKGWDTRGWTEKQYPGGIAGPRQVGGKRPNAWGLYDMLGNIDEWCYDWADPFPGGSVKDPHGPTQGADRINRGGSWSDSARDVRAANRNGDVPTVRYGNLGFRIALAPRLP